MLPLPLRETTSFINRLPPSVLRFQKSVHTHREYPELRLGGVSRAADRLNLSSVIILVPKNCYNYFPRFNISLKKDKDRCVYVKDLKESY